MKSLGRPATIEDIFAVIDRMSAETKAMIEKTEREISAMQKETDRAMKETDRAMKETAQQVKETSRELAALGKNVGGLNRSMGELIETLIAARLWEKFPQYGFMRAYRRLPIYDETSRVRTDIDILLSNSDKVMAVEVKHELDKEKYVSEHVRRMELIRKYPPFIELGTKHLLGAMAGGVVDAEVARYAHESGFYVLELTGETVSLIPPPAGFEPVAW
jgi:hypothetical protein